MSISVVTVRDYEGVPSTRELYARGVRYVINSGGDLEILGEGRPGGPLGYYPSGNWMSVFVDDVVRILVNGEENTSIIGAAPAEAGTDADAVDGELADVAADVDTDAGTDVDADTGTDEPVDIDLEPVSVVDEPDTPIYQKVAEDLAATTAAAETAAETTAETTAGTADDTADDTAGEPAADADLAGDFHTEFDPSETAPPPPAPPKPSRGSIPAGMQPVKFGPRIIRPPKPKVTPDPTRHMMPVTFRSRPLRAGLAKPAPSRAEDEPGTDESGADEG